MIDINSSRFWKRVYKWSLVGGIIVTAASPIIFYEHLNTKNSLEQLNQTIEITKDEEKLGDLYSEKNTLEENIESTEKAKNLAIMGPVFLGIALGARSVYKKAKKQDEENNLGEK